MAGLLSNLVKSLAEKIHKIKCKYRHNNKKIETCRTKQKDCVCCFKYINLKDYLIFHKRLCFNRNYQKSLMNT